MLRVDPGPGGAEDVQALRFEVQNPDLGVEGKLPVWSRPDPATSTPRRTSSGVGRASRSSQEKGQIWLELGVGREADGVLWPDGGPFPKGFREALGQKGHRSGLPGTHGAHPVHLPL